MTSRAVVWFRKDLRLGDNPAWAAASEADEVTALFVVDPAIMDAAGPHRQAQLAAHLRALDGELRDRGGGLCLRRGDPAEVVPGVLAEVGADALHANADAAPGGRRRDRRVHRRLSELGRSASTTSRSEPVPFHTHWGSLVLPPLSVTTKDDTVSKVFTPFYKRWRDTAWDPWPDQPARGPRTAAPNAQPGPGAGKPLTLPDLPCAGSEPHHDGGEHAALARLDAAVQRADRYRDERDRPDLASTSELSTDLHYGTLSPRRAAAALGEAGTGGAALVRQLAWRDWYAHLLWAHPALTRQAMRPEYDTIDWTNDDSEFDAWCAGQTGYPIVDAGMRELTATGWMHNRVRMIVASFLVKDLLVDWRWGEAHFRRLLVDGDTTQNVGNWQWVAGTGPDAAPYFRIFNPTTQATRFDPQGDYVRRWVPEVAQLPDRWVHRPWEAPEATLAKAGLALGRSYPHPLVAHDEARQRTLAVYERARSAGSGS
ncbi:MAG: deoxyribodipyrimidine photo-lyase [Microthrixaceae bacterium]